jgi:hypothetical protein
MKTREELLEEKKALIKEKNDRILILVNRSLKIANHLKGNPPDMYKSIKAASILVRIGLLIKSLSIDLEIIKSQPIAKFPSGGVSDSKKFIDDIYNQGFLIMGDN